MNNWRWIETEDQSSTNRHPAIRKQLVVFPVIIDQARQTDVAAIVRLLQPVDLPAENVDRHLSNFLLARDGGKIIGCGGMEIYGDVCLLRSLAVDPEYRGRGLGRRLLQAIIEDACRRGLKQAIALTKTAEGLATKLGLERISRQQVDSRLAESWEFQSNCCWGATCLRLTLVTGDLSPQKS